MSTRWNPQKPTHTHTHTHTDKPWQVIKQIGTICLMLFSIFIIPTFATEISDPATCDSGTLSTDTGPTNLRANYESNQLNLKWYDDNEKLINVSSSSNACTYGGKIIMPTPPTKKGYTFKGWKVISTQYDFSTLNATLDGTGRYGKGESSAGNETCWANGKGVSCDSSFDDLTLQQWKTLFDYGIIYGDARCSATSGAYATTGTPVDGGGRYCWCMVAKYKPTNSDILYTSVSPLPWVFYTDRGSASDCAYYCAYYCAVYVRGYADFRRAVFGITQQ